MNTRPVRIGVQLQPQHADYAALRDAVQQAGHYATAREAERFYKALAQEIDAACDTTQIPCLPPRATLTAPFRWSDLVDALGPASSRVLRNPSAARINASSHDASRSTPPSRTNGVVSRTYGCSV